MGTIAMQTPTVVEKPNEQPYEGANTYPTIILRAHYATEWRLLLDTQ